MRIFIVHAHHEPTSFNAAMTGTAVQALRAAGHEVRVSDLYAMNFDRRNFLTVKDPLRLKQQDEEAHANAHAGFVPELEAEMAKLAWCEVLVLHRKPDPAQTATPPAPSRGAAAAPLTRPPKMSKPDTATFRPSAQVRNQSVPSDAMVAAAPICVAGLPYSRRPPGSTTVPPVLTRVP